MRRSLAVIKEKDGARGLVPSRQFGIRDKVYGEYLKKLDPRGNRDVQEALAASPDPRFGEFLERISMVRYKKISLQTIAKACGIDLLEFNNWWNKESTQRAIAVAQTSSIRVAADMVEDALSTQAVCPRCDGLTWISAPENLPSETPGYRELAEGKWIRDCPVCDSGRVRKPGDAHARDRVMEMSGIINRNKSAVTLVQNFGGASHPSAVGQLNDAMTFDVSSD